MSFTDDFMSELDKKKKKKKKNSSSTSGTSATGGKSYSEKFMDALGDDISPLPSPTMASIHKYGEDDIAPVKGGDKDSWFKSGGFSDGVDSVGDFFGDLGQTVLGTAGDLAWDVAKGAGRMVEGLVDLGTYGVAGVADKLGADEFAEKARDVAKYSATDEWTKDITDFVDRYSVLGNKADMIGEGLGQVGTIILTGGVAASAGLGAGGVAAVTTGATGLSSMGTGMGEAYNSGATDGEAFWYGLGSGAIEAGTELLFGGLGKSVQALGISRGIGGLDEIFAKKLSSKIAGSIANESVQKLLGNTIEFGVKSAGEGLEEVLSGFGSAVMKKLTYMEDEELSKLVKDENLLEQFVVGTITSSIVQGGDFVKATKSGTDFVTGHTAADEKVINKVVEEKVAKREAAGEKLTTKDKNEIYDSVVDQMEKGQIDIDTIESVLGGDTYKAYKETVDSEDALKNELAELRKMKSGDMNDLQTERMNELKEMNLDDTTKRDGLRKNLDDMLSPMLKDSKLTESYRERERRGQAFEADLSRYTGKKREAVERAVKSGVLNNTYRSHQLVELLSEIEAEKGITFNYSDNKRLKEAGYTYDGYVTNGFADKKTATVTLNVQSSKAWQSVVGHEITHVLETNPDAYNALRESLYAYAESRGELESKRAETIKLYEGKGADIEAELTADLVGDYLFTDKDFVSKLTGNRTLFQKIYDEIKYLWNVATGKEKTEIEKVKAEFDRVWKEYSNNNETIEESSESREYGDAGLDKFGFDEKGQVQYSISTADKAFEDALFNGETETAQKMLDAAAKKAGYKKAVYHGTSADFTVFDTDEDSTSREVHAWSADYPDGTIFVAEDESVAYHYGNKVMPLYLDTRGMKTFVHKDMTAHRAMDDIHGYEVYNYPVIAVKGNDMTIYATLDNTRLKSAELVTTDDDGVIIPLSQRFNTSDPDIRFSLSSSVEETKDLMALHNLHTNEVLKQLEMGGLPYPSVAITKPDMISHDGFGEVSLILKKSAIDPKQSRYNKVYSADAYTPTFPRIDYEADEQAALRIEDKVRGLFDKVPEDYQRSICSLRDFTNLNDELNRAGGEQRLIERYENDYGMKQLYLAEKGEAVPTVINRTETQITEMQREEYQFIVDKMGAETFKSFRPKDGYTSPMTARKQWFEQNGYALKTAYQEWLAGDPNLTEDDVAEVMQATPDLWFVGEARRVYEFIETGGFTVKEEPDFRATEAKIDEKIADSNYKQWLNDMFNGIEGQSGIRNNKDIFLPSGKRRNFKQLHDPVTVDNIVKIMRKEDQKGQGAFGTGNIRGASAKEYSSIAEIKQNSDKLSKMTQEEHDEINQHINDVMYGIARRYADGGDIIDAKKTICEAVAKSESKEGIARYLKQYDYVYEYTDSIGDDIIELRNYIRNLPTPYFEAKPQRAVGFDEVGVFVIPRNADVKLKQELLNRGYSIAEYDPDVEGDRQKVVNQFEEYKFSLSNVGEDTAPVGTPLRELALNKDIESVFGNIAPVGEGVSEAPMQTDAYGHPLPDDISDEETVPLPESSEDIVKTVKERLSAKITNSTKQLEETKLLRDWVKASYDNKIENLQAKYDSKKNKETKVAVGIKRRISNLKRLAADLDTDLSKRISDIESRISKTAERMQEPPKKDILEVRYERINKHLEADKVSLAEAIESRRAELEKSLADKPYFISGKALDLYEEVRSMRKGVKVSKDLGYLLDNIDLSEGNKADSYNKLRTALLNIKNSPNQTVNPNSEIESIARELLNRSYEDAVYELDDIDNQHQREIEQLEAEAEKQRAAVRDEAQALRRGDVRNQKISEVKSALNSRGFDLDTMLDNPERQLSTLETVDTMPQRVMEKTFGYEAGQALSDTTVNKIAQNETEGVKWLDSVTNRKDGLLAQFVKEYNIKPDSKEVAAAQIYAEGSWVDEETGEEFAYGDAELAKDFPDVKVQNNIKALARDPRIRQFYDESLDSINVARKRNGYPEIPRLNNYYLHYREMGDFFTKFGLPFNPNDMKAKDLPTDMVGRTADLKPGQPFFTSSMHRKGKKTTYNLYEGIERYANMAKNQIYHLDDIQTLRALHYYLAERFGQAQGLENLNKLTPEEASEQIKKVYGSHLSTFAAFLDTEANILAGKTSMIDRAFSEGMLGRRILTFMDALNKQTGAAMVGWGVSSANTNWLPAVQEFANANPVDSVKALAQTVANIASRGKFDSFREDSTVYIRRKGADRFNRKLWQKMQDPAYALMGAVDAVGTEIIARTEYNKAIREGMSEQEAHYEADKKVSRLMADRSLGQMPQMYTSRMLGLVTKFQLEVRNYLDSAFYDTLQEEKVAHKDIENALERNAKTAAKVAWRYGATAIAMHMFGKAFESVAGYNPAFDIIEAITKAFGWDDDEDDEDTWRDNLGEGAMSLLEDLPYASIFLDGGRIPISSALPDFKGIITGKDEYGNEKSLGESFMEIAPYMLPAGGNQFKKTYQGLKMFYNDHPVTGSYTDSGSLRFPVEDTPLNRVQAALFGQYASKNAREYFDNGYAPLSEKQIQEYIDVDMPIKDYWEYREGLNDLAPLPGKKSVTLNQKGDYIGSLDLPTSKKNILINNIADRDTPIDMRRYDNYKNFEEFDFAQRFPEKYAVLRDQGISVEDYKKYHEESTFLYTDDYSWAADYPNKYTLSKVISDDVTEYKRYTSDLNEIKGENKKEDKRKYIFNLDIDYGAKCVLFKSQYKADDTYNYDIVNYINNRSDLSYDERVAILTELGFRVTADGQIYSD